MPKISKKNKKERLNVEDSTGVDALLTLKNGDKIH